MKKISVIALVLAFCMCFCLLAGCGAKDNKSSAPKGMKLASGENVDYCMYVPENWKVDKSDLYTSAYFSSGDAKTNRPDSTRAKISSLPMYCSKANFDL